MEKSVMSVGDFIGTQLPKIMNRRKSLRVVLTTYNTVAGYEEGAVNTGDPSLQAKIMSGGLGVPSLEFIIGWRMLANTNPGAADDIRLERRAQAEGAQQAVFGELDEEERPDLIVMYAGLRGFDVTMAKCAEIKAHFPKAYVAVLACDCDDLTKTRTAAPLVANGSIDAFIISPACGGRGDLGNILDALIEQWPGRTKPAPRRKRAA